MITYQVEKLFECLPEILNYLNAHFEEVAANKEQLGGPDMDVAAYQHSENIGQLHILVARDSGKLIGYCVAFVNPHLHYKKSLTAYTDVYYIDPEYRKGSVGVKLFQEYEKTLKQRGVQRMYTGTKKHKDIGKVFEYLGWHETERLYAKWIGE
jgi:GNAT superfamily N-acetyltransferase